MCNLWTLYKYEVKKLTSKKLFIVTAMLCTVCIVLSTFTSLLGTYYVDGKAIETNYEAFKKDQTYQKALSGRYIDETLIQETINAYRHVRADAVHYTLTEEYETFARPYSDIFTLIRSWTGMNLASIQTWEANEVTLYEARSQKLEKNWQSIPLTETEKVFWRNKESQLDTPFLYSYHEGYENMLNCFLTASVLMLLFIAISLSNLFADEHIRRTDQLVLSSIYGKKTAYWAKIFAGISVSVITAALMTFITICLSLAIYGAEGFKMPFQVNFSTYSYPISIGQACMIAYGLLIITSILAAVFVMVISELFHSGIAALSISTALIILGNVIMIPTQYRILAQVWDWSPMAYLSTWNVFDSRTLVLFGHCFASWQIVPFLYLLFSAMLAALGKYIYQRYQISGR